MTISATDASERDLALPPRSRIAAAIGASWTALMGVLPHVLHHVGPLAGAAIVAGTTGTVIFGLAAFVFTVPLLLRMRRHRESWRLPGILLAVFVSVWLISTFVAGPWVRDQLAAEPVAKQQGPVGENGTGNEDGDEEHDEHHDSDDPT